MAAPIDLSGKRVAVVGLGKSGLAALRFLHGRAKEVIGCDDRDEAALKSGLETLGEIYQRPSKSLRLSLGGLRAEVLTACDLIILSPGVHPACAPIVQARAAGVPITGEVELAARFIAAPIVGITGTNGKSTVTSLCGAIAAEVAQESGRKSFCGGNLGTPLIEVVGTHAADADGIVVCELSSYQLETADSLHCRAGAILNLTPDHLDRYASLAAYGDAKARILRNQTPADVLVWNLDDPEVAALLQRASCGNPSRYAFSLRDESAAGTVIGDALRLRLPQGEERYPISELKLIGRHNLANVLAAFLLMRASGLATCEQVRRAARGFQALPHRMQLIAEVAGIRYYDDSKGTNVDAVVAGLDGFPRPLALIAGGRHKGGSYAPLRAVLERGATRAVVVIGEAAPLLAEALGGCAFPVRRAQTLELAVAEAAAFCQPGDAVVLSPACSSFDMFRDYAHRAAVFASAVAALNAKAPEGPATNAAGANPAYSVEAGPEIRPEVRL
jgi:UDP-N-acetylmuramoylalanine--D-glutamate ligase